MLLPSDVARLVLGYLQQEGLNATSRAFIVESPNLKEYAENTTEEGVIPACLFSLFGKTLKTILTEYVAAKTKETYSENQVPAMLSSLWKKVDITINQIKSLQNSPIVYSSQRMRTKNGISRHRALTSLPSSPGPSSLILSAPNSCVSSPMPAAHVIPLQSTPVCASSLQPLRPSPLTLSHPHLQDVSRVPITPNHNTPLQVIVTDQRFVPGPLSPARRKCDSPRRRGGCVASGSGVTRTSMAPSGLVQEGSAEDGVSENFPQMVIENAREKILKDRSLQEKLAENINKILASDTSPQATKAACSSMDPDQSIDEILGLQGEIHMTDDAIQDILEQTESDPAFQALFDLFDYGKGRANGPGEPEVTPGDQEAMEAVEGPADTVDAPALEEVDSSSAETTPMTRQKTRGAAETRKKRKPAASSSVSKNPTSAQTSVPPSSDSTGSGPSQDPKQRISRRLTRATSHALQANNEMEALGDVRMDVDAPALPDTTPVSSAQEQPLASSNRHSGKSPATVGDGLLIEAPSGLSLNVTTSESMADVTRQQDTTQAQVAQSSDKESGNMLGGSPTSKQPEVNPSRTGKEGLLSCSPDRSKTQDGETTNKSPNTVKESEGHSAVPSSVAPSAAASNSSSSSSAMETGPSQIVSLKIIVSDEQEQPSTDSSLNQAVSSIVDERIPTIYLSSPAKSPAKGMLSPPSSSITQEETVNAVSCLQSTEVNQDCSQPPSTLAPTAAATVTNGQQGAGFFQLLPTSNAAPSSYFVVTDQMVASNQQSGLVMVPGGQATPTHVATLPQLVATPPRMQAIPQQYGSTFIISSPVQSVLQNVVLPVSVMGQNNAAKFTVVPNQVLSLPCAASVSQPSAILTKPKPTTQQVSTHPGKTVKSGSGPAIKAQPIIHANAETTKTAASQGHVRMLCFDAPSTDTPTAPVASPAHASVDAGNVQKGSSPTPARTPPSEKHTDTDGALPDSHKPIILGGSRAKRRVETVRVEGKTSQPTAFPTPQNTDQSERELSGRTDQEPISCSPSRTASTRLESRRKSTLTERTESSDTPSDASQIGKACEQSSRPRTKSGTVKKDGKDSSKQETVKVLDMDLQKEERTLAPLQETSPVTSNKENELELHSGGDKSQSVPLAGPETLPSAASPVPSKSLCKTSPLTKKAAEMLQDIQSLNPMATPAKKQGLGCVDLPLPRTPGLGRLQEDSLDGLRTPGRQRQGREGEGTPRQLGPPATPELPTCSPASETGSENSINMAAHTLMILSRAARTGGPLKDSLRQVEAAAPPLLSGKSKKRKHREQSVTDKTDHPSTSGSKKKSKKQKRLFDSFPDNLDVDKFLSSLHYDE